ncbi:hypothetical protein KFL_000110430 [Klebsormidium nitens]|uniref:Vacuolar protein 8 n=1 Tax=Klebsormidium nitens TaxID=105231 RepID=A0A1Y1HIM6_KLENI|nr:hypothetical protein KFL_000110430 [Klebsormidium nitens]|eukprot:GAQ78345.1 hypothetical protein KFL_000110430 [Klebsormidium nitens]
MDSSAYENPFERLSDDLLMNILNRRLWRPLDIGGEKSKERVQLELVSKRFQSVVRTSGSLEWDYMIGSECEEVFMRYMLARSSASASRLTRIALYIGEDLCLMTFLLLLIPQALETLVEVRLFVWDSDPLCVNWEGVFRLLQACRKLTILDITLWDNLPDMPSTVLDFTIPLKPFATLQSLSLYGFAVPGVSFASFIQAFPALQVLELHQLEGESYLVDCSKLKKLFLWRTGGAGEESENPTTVHLPQGLETILSILSCDDSWTLKELAFTKLEHVLLRSAEARKAIVRMPGAVQGLVSNLDPDISPIHTELAVLLLEKLVVEPEAQRILGRVPGNLEKLVDVVIEAELVEGEEVQHRAAGILLSVVQFNPGSREVLAGLPGCVRGLVGFAIQALESGAHMNIRIAHRVLQVLAKLTGNNENGMNPSACLSAVLDQLKTAKVPGLFQGLVDVLDDESARVQKTAGEELARLVHGYDDVKAVAAIPECLSKVVANLTHASWKLQVSSAQTLQNLATDNETARAIVKELGSVDCLFDLVECKRPIVRETALSALYNLAFEPEGRAAIAFSKHLQMVEVLVRILDGKCAESVQEAAAALLGQMALDPASKKDIAAIPGCLPLLTGLLKSGSASVREHVAWVFYGLAEDPKVRKSVAALPGLFPLLSQFLADGASDGMREAGAAALGSLSVDGDTARAVAQTEGCVQGLVGALESGSADVVKEAVKVLRNISGDSQGREMIAREEGAVQRLMNLSKAAEGQEGVREMAAEILQNLEGDPSYREGARELEKREAAGSESSFHSAEGGSLGDPPRSQESKGVAQMMTSPGSRDVRGPDSHGLAERCQLELSPRDDVPSGYIQGTYPGWQARAPRWVMTSALPVCARASKRGVGKAPRAFPSGQHTEGSVITCAYVLQH